MKTQTIEQLILAAHKHMTYNDKFTRKMLHDAIICADTELQEQVERTKAKNKKRRKEYRSAKKLKQWVKNNI